MVTEVWFAQDITQPIEVQHCKGVVFTNDNNGNKIGVRLFNGTAAYSPGGSVTCYVIRPDGVTVNFDGTVSSNALSATLPATALTVPGQISVVLQSVSGSTLTTVFKGVFGCEQGTTGTIVAPSVDVSSLAELTEAVAGKVSKSGDTMTGALSVPGLNTLGNYPGMIFRQSAGSTPTGYITENNATRRMYFTVVPTDAGGNEVFNLPAPSTGNANQRNFDILTTKSPVTVAQGGTGATSASAARSALGAYSTDGGVLTGDIIRQGNGWPAIYFKDANGNNLAAIIYATGSHRLYFREFTSNGQTRDFRFPSAWDETTGGYWDINVTKA